MDRSATNIGVLDNCLNRAVSVYGIFGVGSESLCMAINGTFRVI